MIDEPIQPQQLRYDSGRSGGARLTISSSTQAPTPSGSPPDVSVLDTTLMRGVAWTGALKWAAQILSWAGTLVIARILSPADYGLFAMATVYLGFIGLVNEFGLSSAIIRQRDLSDVQISALGGVSIGLSLLVWGVSALLAYPIAWVFGEPEVRWIIVALGFTFVTSGLRVLPRALLTRDLQFKRAAAIDAVESISGTAITLLLALLGFGYWSLVWGGIASSTLSCLVALQLRPHPRHWPRSLELVRPSLLYGWHLVVARFAWYIYSHSDIAVIGRLFDKVVLGGYGFAATLASIPVTRITSMVAQVTPGIFSAVQHDKELLRRYVLGLTEGLAFITFPFSVGALLVAPDFIMGVLGPHWAPAIVPLQILAIYAGFRSITALHSQILASVGRSRDLMRFGLLSLAVLPPLFVVGALVAGPAGVASAWVVGYTLVMIPPYRAVFAVTGLTGARYLSALWPSMTGCVCMALGVLAVRLFTPENATSLLALGIQVVTGALVYGSVMTALRHRRLKALWAMLRDARPPQPEVGTTSD